MPLVKKFYVKDIKEYEEENNESVLNFFDGLSLYGLSRLVMLGNRGMKEIDAYNLIDDYLLRADVTLVDAFIEIKRVMFGSAIDNINEDKNAIKTEKYTCLSDIYSDFCMSLMSVGINYSEFWSMSTKEMYKVLGVINTKLMNDTNKRLADSYHLAGMIGSAVWGKLPKDIPQIKPADYEESDRTLESKEYGKVDVATLNAILAFKTKGGN